MGVKQQVEVHNVQSPVLVERRVDVPYDVPVYKENIISVPTPVHVDAPYNVPYPVAIQGETIIKKSVAAPVVTHSQHHVDAGVQGYAAALPAAGYAGYAGAAAGYGYAGAAAGYGYAGAIGAANLLHRAENYLKTGCASETASW